MTVEELQKDILKMVDFMSPYDIELIKKKLTRLVSMVRAEDKPKRTRCQREHREQQPGERMELGTFLNHPHG